MSDYCLLFSQTFYGILFSYLIITNDRMYIINSQFLSCCTFNQIIIVNSSTTNAPITKNNSCTLCMPMFFFFCSFWGGSENFQRPELAPLFSLKLITVHISPPVCRLIFKGGYTDWWIIISAGANHRKVKKIETLSARCCLSAKTNFFH